MTRRDRVLARFDRRLRGEGFRHIAGVDEAGRGSLAGPVVAAAVLLPEKVRLPGLDDSKQLEPEERARQALAVREQCLSFAFAFLGPRRIDHINIRQASLLAMRRAFLRARTKLRRHSPDSIAEAWIVLVDGIDTIPGVDTLQRPLIEGDGRSLAVAAASVIAKTVRDQFMVRLSREFPDYGFERNKGYGTEEHLTALERSGPCRWHRFTYSPVAQTNLFAI